MSHVKRFASWKPILAKASVWVLLIGILYVLRSFFLLIFLTFVFGFLQSTLVDKLQYRIVSRKVRVWLVGATLLAAVAGSIVLLVPVVKVQTALFLQQLDNYTDLLDQQIYRFADSTPWTADALEGFLHPSRVAGAEEQNLDEPTSPTTFLAKQLLGLHEISEGDEEADVQAVLSQFLLYSGKVLGIASAFLLSMLFSFLIVLDLPNLRRSVHSLRHSKLRFAYCEVAPSLFRFSHLLGKALEAQFLVAIANSILTAIGLYFLGLGHSLAFLTAIVFLCSFIPVAGVFISSVPICILALQVNGLHGVAMAIVLITFIHLIEGYVLNPRIYGSHLRINPVVVLVILTVFGKLFHVWGLILGVPLCTWFFTNAIRQQKTKRPRLN